MNDKWLKHFINRALEMGEMSRDANTHVGCVFFDEHHKVEVSGGYNDLARGVVHKQERNERPLKYKYTAHAEINCIANAARMGRATYGTSCVVTMFPCSQCAAALINAGIKTVYTASPIQGHPEYDEHHEHTYAQFKEADVTVFLIDDMIDELRYKKRGGVVK